jgi:MFS family permease
MKNDAQKLSLTVTGIGHALNHSYQLMIPPLLPFLANDFNLNLIGLGLLVTAFVAAYGIGQLPAGFLAERIGTKNLIIIGLFICAVGSIAALLSPNIYFLLISLAIMGVGGSTYHPSGLTMLSHAFDETGRGQAMGLHGLAGSVGQIVSPIASGGIAVLQGWKTTFLVYAIMGFGFSIFVFIRWKGRDVAKRTPSQSSKHTNSVKSLLSKAIVVVFLLAIFQGFLYQITTSFMIVYLVDVRLYNVAIASLMLSLLLATDGIGQYIAGSFSDRAGRKKVLIFLTTACIITVLFIPIVPNALLMVLILVFGFFLLALIPTTNALMADLAKGSFGALFGIYYLFGFGVSSAGPPIAGYIGENFGLGGIFYFSGLIGIICLVITFLITAPKVNEQKGDLSGGKNSRFKGRS